MNQLVYIESCAQKIQKQKVAKEKADIDRHNINSKGTIPPDSLKDNSINAELGLATSEEAMLDNLSDKAEKEIISGGSSEKNLRGHCASFLSKLCRNFSLMQKYPELQAFGMLALCRFMIIDANFWRELMLSFPV